jgi:hypothetical protein
MRQFILSTALVAFTSVSAYAQGIIVDEGGALLPEEVTSYVVEEDVPSVSVLEEIVVGDELPEVVVIHRVPRYERYGYAVVNERPVVVETRTRRVIEVLD